MSALPSVLDFSCPWCSAESGAPCTRLPSGAKAEQPHRRRWIDRSAALANDKEFIVEVKENDNRLGLLAGEKYVAIRYWLDPGSKITLLRRATDGHEPECNLYLYQAEFVGWAES